MRVDVANILMISLVVPSGPPLPLPPGQYLFLGQVSAFQFSWLIESTEREMRLTQHPHEALTNLRDWAYF